MAYVTKESYRLAEDTIDMDDVREVIDWLETNPWLTQGRLVHEFEATWAQWLGTRHAVFVNSGSSANLLMYYAMLESDRLANLRVVAPAVSWATTVTPAIQFGFTPTLADAETETFGMDPNHLEDICKRERPGLVIVVHVLGVPCDLDGILALQRRYEFALLEDSCAATGSRFRGDHVGTFGQMSSFSFFFGHHASTIEGGMICTDDEDLYHLLLQLRSHGWAKDLPPEVEAMQAAKTSASEFNRPFTFYHPGFNLRSSDLNARIGLSQMNKLDDVITRRGENHQRYQALVDSDATFGCQHNPHAEISSIAFCATAKDRAHREEATARLIARGIETRPVGGGNMTRQPFWTKRFPEQDLPVADRIAETAFQLPNHPSHSVDDVAYIYRVLAGN